MKIGIVTVYHSYNCGSYLQAYAMQQTLKEFGCDPYFLKNKRTIESRLWFRLLQAVKYTATGKRKRAAHLLRVYRNFKQAQKRMAVVPDYRGMDAAVYGSDTIWNFDDSYFYDSRQRFLGADYQGKKITYAISLGETEAKTLLADDKTCDAVRQLDHISVRDGETEVFVKQCCGAEQPVERVIDPTMLLERKDYETQLLPVDQTGYILFYYFGTIPENIKKQVRAFADKTGRKIVVFGEDRGWADVYVSNEPFLMLSYYQKADFVITNTFHGNVFCLIFNKQFISFGSHKQKVWDLLERFGLSERLAEEDSDFSALFDRQICHDTTNETLAVLRDQSRQYLHKAIFSE